MSYRPAFGPGFSPIQRTRFSALPDRRRPLSGSKSHGRDTRATMEPPNRPLSNRHSPAPPFTQIMTQKLKDTNSISLSDNFHLCCFGTARHRRPEGPAGSKSYNENRHGSSTSDSELHHLWLHTVWHPHPLGMGMVAPLLELCHPQAALEAATQN